MGDESMDESLLARAPCWVFVLVAAADGKVDRKERKRFESLLERDDAFETDWMRTAIAGAGERLEEVLGELEASPAGRAAKELGELATAAERELSPSEATAFKHDLLALGKTVALASGGVLGLGDKLDETEVEALGRLVEILRFEPGRG